MPSTTSHFSWSKPDVGGSSGAWGSILNTTLDAIDAQLYSVSSSTTACLPLTGGTLTGTVGVKDAKFTRVDKGTVSGAQSLDLSAANYFTMTINGATTLSVTNPASGTFAQGFVLRLVNGGSAVITWPNTFRFPGGSPPALTTSGTDLLVAMTDDNGLTWRVVVAGKDIR